MLVVAFATLFVASVARVIPALSLIPLVAGPDAIRLTRAVRLSNGAVSLNEAWSRGVRLHTQFGVLLVVSLVLARLLV